MVMKMNSLKKVLILVIIFLCTACDIKYTVSFQKDNIFEDIEVSGLKFNTDNTLMSPVEFFFQNRIYNYQYNDNILQANQSFNDIDNYKNGSLLFYFVPNGIIKDGNNVSINLETNNEISKYISNFGKINSLEISIYIPYYVNSHNATSVSNNTYTWKINDLEKANIKINFDLSKDYKYKNNLITYILIGGLIVLILGIGIFLYIKNKKNNEI